MTPNTKLTKAVKRYFSNRANKGINWNKPLDLDLIFGAATEQGFNSEACAGTFWFTYKDGNEIKTIYTCEELDGNFFPWAGHTEMSATIAKYKSSKA